MTGSGIANLFSLQALFFMPVDGFLQINANAKNAI
jgi:hypothetical protein